MLERTKGLLLASATVLCLSPLAAASNAAAQNQVGSAEIQVPMHLVDKEGVGKQVGTVTLADSGAGLLLHLDLTGDLPPGAHGFHVHENGSCEPSEKDGAMVPAAAAGGHWDPEDTGKHRGPSGDGHLGDLPVLYVGVDGDGATATKHTLVAPRINDASRLRDLALMIHEGGDNFRDEPKPLGGGGARVACGVIP